MSVGPEHMRRMVALADQYNDFVDTLNALPIAYRRAPDEQPKRRRGETYWDERLRQMIAEEPEKARKFLADLEKDT
ncbi:hypothetical protein GCM10023196_035340 [Actinoallomurus vinaceus]|uniref:Uncharacterized protein n=1 Tax=Actinoallomurus vinaceus TaxID=1080074 RepID=A0ABP8UAA1_9ACTN